MGKIASKRATQVLTSGQFCKSVLFHHPHSVCCPKAWKPPWKVWASRKERVSPGPLTTTTKRKGIKMHTSKREYLGRGLLYACLIHGMEFFGIWRRQEKDKSTEQKEVNRKEKALPNGSVRSSSSSKSPPNFAASSSILASAARSSAFGSATGGAFGS